jgi:hypothetical protein
MKQRKETGCFVQTSALRSSLESRRRSRSPRRRRVFAVVDGGSALAGEVAVVCCSDS